MTAVTAAADVSLTPFEVWGWLAASAGALWLILNGTVRRPSNAAVDEAADRRRRERAEWARRTDLARAAARREAMARAAERGRLAGAAHVRSTVPTHRRWRDEVKGADR